MCCSFVCLVAGNMLVWCWFMGEILPFLCHFLCILSTQRGIGLRSYQANGPQKFLTLAAEITCTNLKFAKTSQFVTTHVYLGVNVFSLVELKPFQKNEILSGMFFYMKRYSSFHYFFYSKKNRRMLYMIFANEEIYFQLRKLCLFNLSKHFVAQTKGLFPKLGSNIVYMFRQLFCHIYSMTCIKQQLFGTTRKPIKLSKPARFFPSAYYHSVWCICQVLLIWQFFIQQPLKTLAC